jgi:xylan 1,4-beta-xylosidase
MSEIYELIENTDGSPIKVLIHSVDKLQMHWHEAMELLLVLDGSLNIRIKDKRYVLNKGDLILINSKEIHSTGKTHEDNMVLALQINPDYYTYFYPRFSDIRIRCNSVEATAEDEEKFEIIRHFLAKIVWDLNKKMKGYKLLIGNEINNLSHYIMNHFEYYFVEDRKDEISYGDIIRIKRILDYIRDNAGNKITLKEIADREHINLHYLSHFFKDKIGITFQEYVTIIRLENAQEQLLYSNDKITHIALKCGFSSTSYFNRVFKEIYNYTPSEYRIRYFKPEGELQAQDTTLEISDKKSKTYLDVDRKAAFKEIYGYLKTEIKERETHSLEPKKTNIVVNISQYETQEEKLSEGIFSNNEPSDIHYWNTLITFGRAGEGLRENVQWQFRQLQKDIKFKYARFHGIFADEMMIYNIDEEGAVVYNWTYVDELFDFFMDIGIKPFIELGFMPSELKRSDEVIFWWKANISPPKDISLWTDLVKAFVKHCINRYGLKEVLTWYFEIWNEPEYIGVFWSGTKEEYFEFFKETTFAVKSIHSKLQVGGPAATYGTAINSRWLDEFLEYCMSQNVFLDFISMHIYSEYIPQGDADLNSAEGNDVDLGNVDLSNFDLNNMDLEMIDLSSMDLSKIDLSKIDLSKVDFSKVDISKIDFSKLDLTKVDLSKIDLTKMGINVNDLGTFALKNIKRIYHDDSHTANTIHLVNSKINMILDYKPELHITEWSASSFPGNFIHDTAYIASFIIKNVLECLGNVNSLGYWALTDIFEERKLGISHFHGGFGLINKDGLKKASYYAYYLLGKLGSKIIAQGNDYIITEDGENIQILAYNYVYFDELFLSGDTSALTHKNRYEVYEEKPQKDFQFILKGLSSRYKITHYYLNKESGSVFDEWLKIGAPENMTKEEIRYLDGVSRPKMKIENVEIDKEYSIHLEIPVHGVELVTFEKRV